MIVQNKFTDKLLGKRTLGVTIFPFIILSTQITGESRAQIINHERVHLRQQLEMLGFLFVLWYFIEYAIRYLKCKCSDKAYYYISLEQEAYQNEGDLKYLEKRKLFSFLKYL